MLGLASTVAGAIALELRRARHRGSAEELAEVKRKERELRRLLEATHNELERAKQHTDAAEEKAQQLEQANAALSEQVHAAKESTSKLFLTNLMLMNKAKHLEDHSRALVGEREDLKHQLEQLQREREAAESGFEASLAALKEQITGVLTRYLSKDIDLQAALQEMQDLGIEVVPLDAATGRALDTSEFETKLVLDSPHRMQRLMSASMRPQLAAAQAEPDVPMLTFPLGISKDPATGAPRITLGWRSDPQCWGASQGRISLPGPADAAQQRQDQAASNSGKAAPALQDTAGPDTSKAASASGSSGSIKAATAVVSDARGGQALTFGSPQRQQQQKQGGGATFSLPFGGLGRASGGGGGGSSGVGGKGGKAAVAVPPSSSALLQSVGGGGDAHVHRSSSSRELSTL